MLKYTDKHKHKGCFSYYRVQAFSFLHSVFHCSCHPLNVGGINSRSSLQCHALFTLPAVGNNIQSLTLVLESSLLRPRLAFPCHFCLMKGTTAFWSRYSLLNTSNMFFEGTGWEKSSTDRYLLCVKKIINLIAMVEHWLTRGGKSVGHNKCTV